MDLEKEIQPYQEKTIEVAGSVAVVIAILMLLVTNGSIGTKFIAMILGVVLGLGSFYLIGVGGLKLLIFDIAESDTPPEKGTEEYEEQVKSLVLSLAVMLSMLLLVIIVAISLFWDILGPWTILLPVLSAIAGFCYFAYIIGNEANGR